MDLFPPDANPSAGPDNFFRFAAIILCGMVAPDLPYARQQRSPGKKNAF
jgi:hypothetical protein